MSGKNNPRHYHWCRCKTSFGRILLQLVRGFGRVEVRERQPVGQDADSRRQFQRRWCSYIESQLDKRSGPPFGGGFDLANVNAVALLSQNEPGVSSANLLDAKIARVRIICLPENHFFRLVGSTHADRAVLLEGPRVLRPRRVL